MKNLLLCLAFVFFTFFSIAEAKQPLVRKLKNLTEEQKQDLLRRTFTEDPYAFTEAWEDGAAFRAELEQFHRNMAPEEAAGDRRRLAMAAYYFGFQPGMFDYAYDNFEQFSNKANGGKQLDAWADFDRVAQSFGVQQAKPEESQPGFFSGGWMVVLFLILILIIFTLKTVLKYVKTCATSMCKFLQNIFSKENYFKTCILIFYFVIAISMISIAFKICL